MAKRLASQRWTAKARVAAAGLTLICVMVAASPDAAAAACPKAPPAVKGINLPRFYADQAGSVVDAKLDAAHKAAVQPLTEFLRHVTSDADKAWRRSKPAAQAEAGRCAVSWIAAWASGDAWLGRMETRQAEYQRKWDLAGVALAYLKVRRFATPEQRRVIEPWLQRFADATRGFFDDPARKRNNHWYWLGLAVGAVALATDSERHWGMARGIMEDAARDIASDGTIAEELTRKGRALHYHAFAAMPLVALAELAHSKNENWYQLGDGALHRLAGATLAGLRDPKDFERRVGEAQDPKTSPGAGWAQLYSARFPDRVAGPISGVADGHRWLGGNVGVLSEALAKRR